ncbi:hypothetical protein [Aquabacterium sp.]|uniref:hypothetical protein n=1 Tax=Aquabacterium sp. TaxID=1872578 RepID=UPI002CE6CCB2|nr:hypothetical protein [Aquabacterium sp.]HSW04685.1 hypothetical protein [Aquabacterium sp.]
MFRRSPHRAAWLAGAFCLAAAFALYGSTLRNSWCCDDTQILQHALRFAPWQYFFEPAAWRALVPYSLTPWLTLSYELDHALAGMQAGAYYAHHLLMIGLAAALIWRLAALWVGPVAAASGALLFLLGVPIAQASQLLMVRHYTEGLVFYGLALLLFAQRLRGGPGWLLLACGLAYAVAASAKEIYLPLGAVALLLPLGSWGQRLRAAVPFGVVMLLYVPWRWFMLGDPIGGYTPPGALAATEPALLRQQLAGLPALLWRWPLLGGGAWLLVVAVALWRSRQRWPAVARLAAAAVLLLLPLLPLLRFPGLVAGNERYLIGLWAALSLGFAIALGRACAAVDEQPTGGAVGGVMGGKIGGVIGGLGPAPRGAAALVLFAAVAVPAWLASTRALESAAAVHREHRAFADTLRTEPADSVVLLPAGVADWFAQGLLALRPAMALSAAPPRLMADDVELAALPAGTRRVLRYDPASDGMTNIAADLPARLAAWRSQLRAEPMTLTLERQISQQGLRWQFSATQPGRYSLLAPGQRLDVPAPAGALRLEQPLPACFRIRFDADAGGSSYSPPLALPAQADADGLQRLHWQGHGERLDSGAPGWCGSGPQ